MHKHNIHPTQFIERIRKGGESVFGLRGDLATIASKAPWDGKDAVVEEVEEFDLDELFGDDEDEAKTEL